MLFFGREIKNHGITVLLRIGLPGELRDFYNPASLPPRPKMLLCEKEKRLKAVVTEHRHQISIIIDGHGRNDYR